MESTITTKRPTTPAGYRRFKYCGGGYKESILGKTVNAENVVWAEVRYDKNALFAEDRKYYRLYTFIKN